MKKFTEYMHAKNLGLRFEKKIESNGSPGQFMKKISIWSIYWEIWRKISTARDSDMKIGKIEGQLFSENHSIVYIMIRNYQNFVIKVINLMNFYFKNWLGQLS